MEFGEFVHDVKIYVVSPAEWRGIARLFCCFFRMEGYKSNYNIISISEIFRNLSRTVHDFSPFFFCRIQPRNLIRQPPDEIPRPQRRSGSGSPARKSHERLGW
jgi:hypothetical protein